MRKHTFQRIEPRLTDPFGEADDSGFKDTADTIALSFCFGDGFFHMFALFFVQNGKALRVQEGDIVFHIVKSSIGNAGAFGDMCTDMDTVFFECLDGDCACGNESCRDSAREMSAAARIGKTVILAKCGIIRMTGSSDGLHFFIISAMLIAVLNDKGDGRSRGLAVYDTTYDMYDVGFLSRGGKGRNGTAQIHLMCDKVFVNVNAGCHAVEDRTDGNAVAFTEKGNGNAFSKRVFHLQKTSSKTVRKSERGVFFISNLPISGT